MFLRRRQDLHEYLDDADIDPALAAQGYRFMAAVNRRLGGVRVVRLYVDSMMRRLGVRRLRVLDVGAGICDIAAAVSVWAAERGCEVTFDCIEPSPHAAGLAAEHLAAAQGRVRLVRADAFTHQPDDAYDCAVGSLFFHHLSDQRALELLRRLRGFVRHGVLVNDLYRDALHYAGAAVLSAWAPAKLRHDALVSIRRSFCPRELKALLAAAGCSRVAAGVTWLQRVWAVGSFR
jgi:predicted nicotinamide N-methyase